MNSALSAVSASSFFTSGGLCCATCCRQAQVICQLALLFLAASATEVRSASRRIATICSSANGPSLIGSSFTAKSHASSNQVPVEAGQLANSEDLPLFAVMGTCVEAALHALAGCDPEDLDRSLVRLLAESRTHFLEEENLMRLSANAAASIQATPASQSSSLAFRINGTPVF